MMGWYDGSWGPGGGWFLMMLGMALFWGVVVYAIVSLVRSSGDASVAPTRGQGDTLPHARAQAILEERFARGEIDADEYEARRRVLDGG